MRTGITNIIWELRFSWYIGIFYHFHKTANIMWLIRFLCSAVKLYICYKIFFSAENQLNWSKSSALTEYPMI